MNKKTIALIIISVIIAIGLIVGGFMLKYYASFHKVTIDVKSAEITVDIYRMDPSAEETNPATDAKIDTTKGIKVLSLQAGGYYAVPQGNKYDASPVNFTVADKDISVSVNPGLSSTYLSSLLEQEQSTINQVITTKYPIATTGFKLNDGKIYNDGTWYGTTIVQNAISGNNGDVYRTVLHKVNGVWQFAATPAIVLSAPEHTDIPENILKDLNSQSGY